MAVPVHMRTPGVDQSADAVLRFFQHGYDIATLRRESHSQLDSFSSVQKVDHEHFDVQIDRRWRGAFNALKTNRPSSFSSLRKSLSAMSKSARYKRLSLAPAFVLGIREAGKPILGNRDIVDSFDNSGLDNLFKTQAKMRARGFVPKALPPLAKGPANGAVNPELPECSKYLSGPASLAPTKCRIHSAAIPASQKFLMHAARFALAFDRFAEEAKAQGFDDESFADLPEVAHFFWMALALQRPFGRTIAAQRASSNDAKFGTRTYLGFLRENNLGPADAVNILDHSKIMFHRPKRRLGLRGTIKIGVRSAALIAALDLMMHRHLTKRVGNLQLASEFALIEGYLN